MKAKVTVEYEGPDGNPEVVVWDFVEFGMVQSRDVTQEWAEGKPRLVPSTRTLVTLTGVSVAEKVGG